MRDKVAVALTNAKLQAQTAANTLMLNRDFLRGDDSGQDWITLFPDFPAMGVKEPEVFKAMATMRINDFKQAEAQRLEAERARIRAEEEAKAKREAEAKAAAEANEQARQLEADRARIRAEEQQKAQADAAQQRQQVQRQAQEVQAEISQAAQDGALAAHWPPTCQALPPSRRQKAWPASTLSRRSARPWPALQWHRLLLLQLTNRP